MLCVCPLSPEVRDCPSRCVFTAGRKARPVAGLCWVSVGRVNGGGNDLVNKESGLAFSSLLLPCWAKLNFTLKIGKSKYSACDSASPVPGTHTGSLQ